MNSYSVTYRPLQTGANTHISNISPYAKQNISMRLMFQISMNNDNSVVYRRCDVIVEVCHPQIVKEFGLHFLSQSHFLVRNVFLK